MIKILILKTLLIYKKYLSKGYSCRFVPTCSEYTYEAVEKYGVVKGGFLGIKRIMRCNPWSSAKQNWDPVK